MIASSMTFQQLKSSRNRIGAPGEGRHMRMPTLNEIESQTDEADGNRLNKPCKKIGQKSDKAKCKLLKRELLSCEGKVLQNLYSAVRSPHRECETCGVPCGSKGTYQNYRKPQK